MYTSEYIIFNNTTKKCQFLRHNQLCFENGELLGYDNTKGEIVAELDISFFKWVKNHCKKSVTDFKRKVLQALTIDFKADTLNTDNSIYKKLLSTYDIEISF